MFIVKGSRVNVTEYIKRNVSAVKRYKTETDRLVDFKLGMGVSVTLKRLMTGAASGGLKLQCIAIATFSS